MLLPKRSDMHTAFRRFLSALLLVLFVCAAHAQPVYELSPDESVRLGLERNLHLRAAHAEAAVAQAAYREARAGRLPVVRARADYTRLIGDIPEVDVTLPGFDERFTILPVEFNRYHSEVTVEQPLFSGFRIRNQVRAAAHEAGAAALFTDQEETDVAFEIRRVYWSLFEAIALRDAVSAATEQIDAHVRGIEVRLAEGTALRSELLTARTRRSEVLLDRVEAENAVRVAQLELSRLIGLPLDTSVELVPEFEPVDGNWDSLAEDAAATRPQVRALTEQVQALRLQIDVARGAWLPEVALTGRYVYARPNPYFFAEQDRFRGAAEAGLMLRWNLFEGGRRPAETERARAHLFAAEARLEDARERVAVEVARQRLEVQRASEAVRVAEQHVEEAGESYRVVRQQFAEGVVLSTQVLDAEQAYRTAKARQAQALAAFAVARAAHLHATGRIW